MSNVFAAGLSRSHTRRIGAVIFDFDGVIVDSEPLHEWAILETVRPRGWSFKHEQFVAQIVGRGDENAFRRIAEWNGTELPNDELPRLLERKWTYMREGIESRRFTIQPGAIDTIRAAKRRGPIGVCSGSVRATVVPMLEAIGVRELLSTVVCGDDNVRMKPAPDGYLEAAANIGVAPEHCMAIEDTPTGVAAARAAGMYVIGVGHTLSLTALGEAHAVAPWIEPSVLDLT
jgi:beta-phosphoglucomutase